LIRVPFDTLMAGRQVVGCTAPSSFGIDGTPCDGDWRDWRVWQNFEQFFALGSFGLHFCLFIQASRLVSPRLSNFRVVARVPSRFVPRLLASNACLRTSPTVFYSQAVIHELCHVQQHG
jgi:hypothetical protein